LTISLAPHCWQWSPKNVVLPQAGQATLSPCPQCEHDFQLSLIGDLHLGHL